MDPRVVPAQKTSYEGHTGKFLSISMYVHIRIESHWHVKMHVYMSLSDTCTHTHTTLHCSTLRCPTFRLHNKIHCIALYYTTLHCIHTYYANKMCCLHIIESYIITYVHVHTYEWPLAILAKMQSMRLTAPVLSTCIKLWVWFARRAHWIIIGSAWMDWWPTVQSHLMALHEHCQSQ